MPSMPRYTDAMMKKKLPRLALVLPLFMTVSKGGTVPTWSYLYQGGFKIPSVNAWTSDLTRSRKTTEGLHIVDPTSEKGSGRFYYVEWHASPETGAVVEARLKVASCSEPWGVALLLADGVHEEGVSFFPDKVMLTSAQVSSPFDAASEFHTYRVEVRGHDIKVSVDGKLLLDGAGKFTAPAIGGRNQVGFGSGSSTAQGDSVWQLVRFQVGSDADKRPKVVAPMVSKPKVPGLDVKVGETQVLQRDANYVSMFKFADGSLVVGDKRSRDGGKTWQRAPVSFGVGAYQCPEGDILSLGFLSEKSNREGYFTIPLSRSADNGKTSTEETASLHIPEATGGTGDDGKSYTGPPADHAIVRLRDGSLLAAMYGQFKTDRVLTPTMPVDWQCFKYRTFVVRSADRGKTWEYLSTVAYDPSVGLESFCEADLLTLPGGDLLSFMRTGGSGEKYTPLYLSRSTDDGRTWSKPEAVADRGVWPNACRMKSGVLACTYGRPGNWLMFSLDSGRTWKGHFCFYEGETTSYNSVEEVAPNTLLVVYDRKTLNDGGNMTMEVVGTKVTVKRR